MTKTVRLQFRFFFVFWQCALYKCIIIIIIIKVACDTAGHDLLGGFV